ncbi:MAG: nucleotidyltransferase domain-containing protein [Ignavibacteria bacterium]|nr:nucleotidyltransferase domain-containing protein [Ignavibacteria bacterium]
MTQIKFSQKQLIQLKKMDILVVYLFGSRAQGFVNPLSDFDIGIIFENPENYKDKTLEVYSILYNVFGDVLPKAYLKQRFKMRVHEFDIVFLQFAPISFQFEAISQGKVLYEKDREKRLDYEEYVMKSSCDLKYFHDIREQAILERI